MTPKKDPNDWDDPDTYGPSGLEELIHEQERKGTPD